MVSFHAGLRAWGNSSTATTRPTRMSTARNWSKSITGPGSRSGTSETASSGRRPPPRRAGAPRPTPASRASAAARRPASGRSELARRVGEVLARRRLRQQHEPAEQPARAQPRAELDVVAGHGVHARLALARELEL